MSDKELEALKHGVEGATAGLLRPVHELITKLAGPAAEELGLTWQDHVRVWRFSRAVRLATKVQELLVSERQGEWQSVPLKVLLPSLEHASLEDDDNLQDHWATLLANATNSQNSTYMVPVFVEILKQLSSFDAILVDSIYKYAESEDDMIGVLTDFSHYIPRGNTKIRKLVRRDEFERIRISVENLIRLGLVMRRQVRRSASDNDEEPNPYEDASREIIKNMYYRTSLGRSFISGCSPVSASDANRFRDKSL